MNHQNKYFISFSQAEIQGLSMVINYGLDLSPEDRRESRRFLEQPGLVDKISHIHELPVALRNWTSCRFTPSDFISQSPEINLYGFTPYELDCVTSQAYDKLKKLQSRYIKHSICVDLYQSSAFRIIEVFELENLKYDLIDRVVYYQPSISQLNELELRFRELMKTDAYYDIDYLSMSHQCQRLAELLSAGR